MKKFFTKAAKPASGTSPPPAAITTATAATSHNPALHVSTGGGATAPHTTGLLPKYVLPAVPHPCPHNYLAVLIAKEGLLVRPHVPGHGVKRADPGSYVKIAWGKNVNVEEVTEETNVDWGGSVVVYGIVGFLELFTGSYLLVITSRSEIGNLIDPVHAVYGVKGITAVPLTEPRARIVLNTLASRNAAARPSLLPSTTFDTVSSLQDPDPGAESDLDADGEDAHSRYPRVQFSSVEQIKLLTPLDGQFPGHEDQEVPGLRPSSRNSFNSDVSGVSTPTSEHSVTTSPVAKTVASRLSFWSRMSQRTPTVPSSASENGPLMGTVVGEDDLDEAMSGGKEEPAAVLENILAATAPIPSTKEEQRSELEDKVVRECIREFTKGGMYFSYNFDITRSLQQKQDQAAKSQRQHDLLADLNALPTPKAEEAISQAKTSEGEHVNLMSEPFPTLPLWRRVDKQFWWNEWMSKPFIDAGLHSYVLPIMQGYYQIATFNMPPDPITHDENTMVDYIIVSRRSRDRAGLRYQRRGIDDDAHVANFVETETIMRVQHLGIENIFSYVQIRGSIPLFWTQSGYGLKPPPLLAADRTHMQNMEAIKRHFQRTVPVYGPHAAVNLAEQHGKEAAITQGYRDCMRELDSKDVQYHEYDFHTETKGMKYENISKLIGVMERTFDAQGFFWIANNTVMSRQKGVFRINCIDCLDRTNVVQSAFARYVLNKQLGAAALLNPSAEGRTDTDVVFNDVWANNGDAISRAYAGTSALKGDFTRTGKRDLGGLLNDGVNSLARMYTSTFSDWFCQAVIDFMLGNRTLTVFSEFLLKLQSTDPRDLIRLSKIRAEAIATSVSRVLSEGERLLSGWTLFAPEELNTKIGMKFEEKVLLLTVKALYIISYDYTLEKVKIYTRVPLGDIIGISKGAYILSPLEEASRDPLQNAGFVISWLNSNQITRVTSYSVRNSLNFTDTETASPSPTPSNLSSSQAPARKPVNINASLASVTRTFTLKGKGKPPALSNILSNASTSSGGDSSFAAFKVLPIDPARTRRTSSGGGGGEMYAEASDELNGAGSCLEAVDLIVDCIRRACEDIGGAGDENGFVVNKDVVSLAEAQRMTSVYAKMEYGVKRLLWLGG